MSSLEEAGAGAVLRGWLLKESDRVRAWRRRWCVLRPPFLLYAKAEGDDLEHPKGVIPLLGSRAAREEGAGAGRGRFAFTLAHRGGKVFRLAAASEAERDEWVEALGRASSGPARHVFLQYRGKEISDPEDAKQIAVANASVRSFVYERYDQARDALLAARAEAAARRAARRELKQQKRALAREVKALRAQLQAAQEAYDERERALENERRAERARQRELAELAGQAGALLRRLAATDPAALAADPARAGNTQLELVELSQAQLRELGPEVRAVSQGGFAAVRGLFEELLVSQHRMRAKEAARHEHIEALTVRKLETFEQKDAGASADDGDGGGGGGEGKKRKKRKKRKRKSRSRRSSANRE